jgi:hypothetical protein
MRRLDDVSQRRLRQASCVWARHAPTAAGTITQALSTATATPMAIVRPIPVSTGLS